MADTAEPNRLAGKVKWLDSQGIGYILPDNPNFPEAFVTPLSLSSNCVIKEGDCVEFTLKSGRSEEPFHAVEAIDVVPSMFYCFNCIRYGHKFSNCPEISKLQAKCTRCGLSGHSRENCDQKYKGWFFNKWTVGSDDIGPFGFYVHRGYCNDWLSLFAGANNGVVGPVSKAAKMVCVEKREDVKKVEEVEDCFILEFDPTLVDDDDGKKGGSVRSIVCVKKREDVKKVEEVEDCFILEFDPSIELDKLSNLSLCDKSDFVGDHDDVSILAVKGKVACRDYPHPRHLCANHPFKRTSHALHCKMCYCYICDVPAPCKKWNEGFKISGLNHCDATDESSFWRTRRDLEKELTQGR